PRLLAEAGGPATTPSGAAGLAGLLAVLADPARAADLRLDRDSRILVLVTEAALEGA
ncbi:PLP-dependent lyase/thiolase, partial [Methylobacterium terricola]